ncbi:MAG: FxSxx-COOH system tetratricopeptide repeat protein [Mycobacteriales bacterium]
MADVPRVSGREAETRRFGLQLTWYEVADALWLSTVLRAAADPSVAARPERSSVLEPDPGQDGMASSDGLLAETGGQESRSSAVDDPSDVQVGFAHSASDAEGQTGWHALAVPERRALTGTAALARTLRALKEVVSSSRLVEPDEEAIAEHAVVDDVWMPYFRSAGERRWDVVVIVDDSPTMVIWQELATAFTELLRRQGAFRDVLVVRLETDGRTPDELVLRGPLPGSPPRGVAELFEPADRRLVLVLTDARAPAWHVGAVQPLLRMLGSRMPVALLHLLPQRLWHRTGIQPSRLRLFAPAPGVANCRLTWEHRGPLLVPDDPEPGLVGRPASRSLTPIPVMELSPRWLARWVTLVAGAGARGVDLTALLATEWKEPEPGARFGWNTTGGEGTAWRRVADFRAVASPLAFRLATYLAAAPLNLPVIRMIQRTLLPSSHTSHLAEILLSGLLRPAVSRGALDASDRVTLDFAAGIRDELLAAGRREETVTVLRAVADYLGPTVVAVRGLRHVLADPDGASEIPVTRENEPYLRVEHSVLRALSGRYLARARRLGAALRDTEGELTVGAKNSGTLVFEPSSSSASLRPLLRPPGLEPVPPTQQGGSSSYSEGAGVSITADPAGERQRTTEAPMIWGNIPPRNPNFTGREDLLEALHQRLGVGTTAVLPEALHGMGGVGKSQLAVEYVYRHQSDYDVIWWVPSDSGTQIARALADLAQRLDLGAGAEANMAVPAVREALRVGKPYANWLLVFDNAESPETVRRYFPTGGPGCILVTSRNPQWATVARPVEVDVFTRAESVELLRKRGPELINEEADRLAEALGDLPLAIEQAAAWRAESGMSAAEYLRLFEEKRADLLAVSPPLDYQLPVAAAWNVSLDQLRVRSPGALRLLQVCAYFAPEPISRSLLASTRGIEIVPELDAVLRDPIQLGRAIREISRYALARIDHRTNSIQMHRLVQAVLDSQMSDQERNTMRHGAHRLLANNDPNEPDANIHWPRYAELYPHLLAAGAVDCKDAWVRQLLVNEARYLYHWGEYESSCDLSERTYEAWRRHLGDDDPQTLAIAKWLGFMLFVVGRYADAAEINARTLEVYRRTAGDDHEDTLDAIGAVAADRRVQGRFHAALELSEDVYHRSLRLFGADDPATLNAAHNLGVSLRLAGEFAKAYELDADTWRRKVQLFGEDHQLSLVTLVGLMLDRRELGEYLAARSMAEDIVLRYRRLVDADNPALLRAVRLLAVARRKAGDHEGARAASEEARTRLVSRYGEDHPEAMAAALNLSIDQREIGNLDTARALGAQTRDRYRRTLGEGHPHTLAAAMNLAIALRLLGEGEEARAIDADAHAELCTALGDDHVVSLASGMNLASDLCALDRTEEALELDQEILTRCQELLGTDHPTTLACEQNLSIDLRALRRESEAERIHAETTARLGQTLGAEHPATVEAAGWNRANCDVDPLQL